MPSWVEDATRLYSNGLSYRQIGKALGVSHSTVLRALNPIRRATYNARQKTRSHKERNNPIYRAKERESNKQRQQFKRATSFEYRCQAALRNSRAYAKRRGYAPCLATIEELVSAHTGRCHLCGVPESECPKRLAVDHDHQTGMFRGWLCLNCNTTVGRVEPNLAEIQRYVIGGAHE